MIDSTAAYKQAVIGEARRTYIRAVVDIVSPTISYGTPSGSKQADGYSNPEQIHDMVFESGDKFQTFELNRWLLDGKTLIMPNEGEAIGEQIGYIGDEISGSDGAFGAPQTVTLPFSGVSLLQACSVYFSEREDDGVPLDFTVEVLTGETVMYTASRTNNRDTNAVFVGFEVQSPDAMRITVTRWSIPYRRMRIIEVLPGLHEIWSNDNIAAFSGTQQTNFANLALPYGTCALTIDNRDRRFDPRSKTGMFRSIEERQGIDAMLGVRLPDGTTEYKPIGRYYQYSGGWETSSDRLTIKWDLVDIIGLLTDRYFTPPATLPTTLSGWAAAIVAHLGVNFANEYVVDAAHAADAVTVNSAAAVSGKTCGEILRYICMATGTWCRADAKTGKLLIEPMREGGNALTLGNMTAYPGMRANNDVGELIFTLADTAGTTVIFAGNEPASNNSITISNPFIHTTAKAAEAAAAILQYYGGNIIETIGRGDPSSEIGDTDEIEIERGETSRGLRQSQSFAYASGVLQGCQSVFLEVEA